MWQRGRGVQFQVSLEIALLRSFGRSEGNGTSQLLVSLTVPVVKIAILSFKF